MTSDFGGCSSVIPRGAAALRCTGDLRGMRAPQIKGCSMSRGGITAELQPFYWPPEGATTGGHIVAGGRV